MPCALVVSRGAFGHIAVELNEVHVPLVDLITVLQFINRLRVTELLSLPRAQERYNSCSWCR